MRTDETETSLLIDGLTPNQVDCYSCIPKYNRRLIKIATALGIEYTVPHEGAVRVTLPAKCFSLRVPAKQREMSEEEKAKVRDRFATLRNKKKGGE